jgi:glycerophosphoryl diester phosphodiesterase
MERALDPGAHGPRPLVIGHRGAPRTEQENTVASFAAAAAEGAHWVELDVHLTADGDIVVVHDPTYADGRLTCATPTNERPAGVPLLDEVLDTCDANRLGVNIEIKAGPGEADHHVAGPLTDAVLALIDGRYASNDQRRSELLITSFWPETIDRARAGTDVATGWLTVHVGDPASFVTTVAERGHQAINPWDAIVDATLVEAAHARGLAVNVWTVNEPARIRELAAWGVDGIITDTPAAALDALGAGT